LRGSVSLVFALVKGEGYSPAHEGIRGVGRHLRSGPAAAAKATYATTLADVWPATKHFE